MKAEMPFERVWISLFSLYSNHSSPVSFPIFESDGEGLSEVIRPILIRECGIWIHIPLFYSHLLDLSHALSWKRTLLTSDSRRWSLVNSGISRIPINMWIRYKDKRRRRFKSLALKVSKVAELKRHSSFGLTSLPVSSLLSLLFEGISKSAFSFISWRMLVTGGEREGESDWSLESIYGSKHQY